MNKAIFMDRDGTINEDFGYVYKFEDWVWKKNALSAISNFKKDNFLIFVITNQAGIARGFYQEVDVLKLHKQVDDLLFKLKGIRFNKFSFCPHHPEYGERIKCKCRKPNNGMLERLINEFSIDRSTSWMLGDKTTDIQAGIKSKLNVGLVYNSIKNCDYLKFKDLLDAYNFIKN